jgi:hypothetical protein
MIVIVAALLSGAGRGSSSESQRPVTRIEIAPSGSARATTATKESGSSGGIIPALILLLTVMALAFSAG